MENRTIDKLNEHLTHKFNEILTNKKMKQLLNDGYEMNLNEQAGILMFFDENYALSYARKFEDENSDYKLTIQNIYNQNDSVFGVKNGMNLSEATKLLNANDFELVTIENTIGEEYVYTNKGKACIIKLIIKNNIVSTMIIMYGRKYNFYKDANNELLEESKENLEFNNIDEIIDYLKNYNNPETKHKYNPNPTMIKDNTGEELEYFSGNRYDARFFYIWKFINENNLLDSKYMNPNGILSFNDENYFEWNIDELDFDRLSFLFNILPIRESINEGLCSQFVKDGRLLKIINRMIELRKNTKFVWQEGEIEIFDSQCNLCEYYNEGKRSDICPMDLLDDILKARIKCPNLKPIPKKDPFEDL